MIKIEINEMCTTVVHTALLRLDELTLAHLRKLLAADPKAADYPRDTTQFQCTATFNTGDVCIVARLEMLDDGPLFVVRLLVADVEHDVAETFGEINPAYDLTTVDDGDRAAIYRLEITPEV